MLTPATAADRSAACADGDCAIRRATVRRAPPPAAAGSAAEQGADGPGLAQCVQLAGVGVADPVELDGAQPGAGDDDRLGALQRRDRVEGGRGVGQQLLDGGGEPGRGAGQGSERVAGSARATPRQGGRRAGHHGPPVSSLRCSKSTSAGPARQPFGDRFPQVRPGVIGQTRSCADHDVTV